MINFSNKKAYIWILISGYNFVVYHIRDAQYDIGYFPCISKYLIAFKRLKRYC